MTFPTGSTRENLPSAEVPSEANGDITSGHVRRGARGGPVGVRADGRPLAPFRPPARSASARGTAGDPPRQRASAVALLATEDRLYNYVPGGVVVYDRATAAVIWARPVAGFQASPRAENMLLVEGGPPGVVGDTLFLAGSIQSIDGQPRDRFAALDAETGALLDWNVNPVGTSTGVAFEIATLEPGPADAGGARLYLGGDGLFTFGGLPRENLAAADRTTGEILPWAPTEPEFGAGMVAQPGPDGGIAGGVVYSQGVALDAETAELVPGWALETRGVSEAIISERHGRIIFVGAFANALRGSGHAHVIAVTPARPFIVSSEPGTASEVAALSLAGPNPFRVQTALVLTLPSAQTIEAVLYDVLGRRINVLHEGPLAAGQIRLDVNGAPLSTGVYIVRVTGASFSQSQMLTVVK